VQATVRTFDPRTGAGDVLLDDGRAVAFPPHAFLTSGLRLLRLGQRVRLETDTDGRITRLTLATLPFPD
jgi:2-phospho-L-lactate guanylyltransferase